jgi:hypothetical protein
VLGDLRQVDRLQMGLPNVGPGLMRIDPGVVHPRLQVTEIGHGASWRGGRPGPGARPYPVVLHLRCPEGRSRREMIIYEYIKYTREDPVKSLM